MQQQIRVVNSQYLEFPKCLETTESAEASTTLLPLHQQREPKQASWDRCWSIKSLKENANKLLV